MELPALLSFMKLSQLQYTLPNSLIATKPVEPRDSCKLMVITRSTGLIEHKIFKDLTDILTANDVLVFNDTKVIKANIIGKKQAGAKVEVLLIKPIDSKKNIWECMGKNIPNIKEEIFFENNLVAEVISKNGKYVNLFFHNCENFEEWLDKHGNMPIPPYIRKNRPHKIDSNDSFSDNTTYQTVYAKSGKSIAAPTAGLHFTNSLLAKLKSNHVDLAYLNLEVGLGTFEPVKADNLKDHDMHKENYSLTLGVAQYLNNKKEEGKRIIAVGTTTTRVLETVADRKNKLNIEKLTGSTRLLIQPPYEFKFIDGLITNFHLPGSTLLALVYAFAGKNLAQKAYSEAIENNYRFFSYGDAMLII